MRAILSIVTPCYNEESNIKELYDQITTEIKAHPEYQYEIIFIDNASTDNTVPLIKSLIKQDQRVRLIVNARNFGHIRSPYYGLIQAKGEAVILMASDLQDPPHLIPKFIKQWEAGYKIVAGVKTTSEASRISVTLRKWCYKMLNRISNIKLINNFTGFGLYDQSVVEILRGLNDSYPYLRGLVSELGFDVAEVAFTQPRRKRGITKNNLYTLYDISMLGITSHSKVPLRLAVFAGFILSAASFLMAIFYLILKLLFWDSFAFGTAPMLMGLFFFASVQLFFLGLIGEYIGNMQTQILNRPLVVEKERVNF